MTTIVSDEHVAPQNPLALFSQLFVLAKIRIRPEDTKMAKAILSKEELAQFFARNLELLFKDYRVLANNHLQQGPIDVEAGAIAIMIPGNVQVFTESGIKTITWIQVEKEIKEHFSRDTRFELIMNEV